MSVCYIFSGGEMSENDLNTFEIPPADYVICADAGYVYAQKFGFKTDCLLGDFDTLDKLPQREKFSEFLKFKCEKDDTDTMLAVRHALKKDFDEIYIFGALGGRFDHTFANIQTLDFIASHNKIGVIISQNEYITVLKEGSYEFKKYENFTFSVFSLTSKTTGIYEKGFKYSLDNATLTRDFPLGVCNEILGSYGEISFEKGRLLVVMSKNQKLF